ncbi:hypothetical protein OsJ_02840 [Oryza sativa Japonica Group]|uniref:Phospholipase A1 n=1 Tax=Oryza sativa subsp. japonica TaxID=39947 RepID=B9EYC9_ORYSJ|nr:hypothetical protein OsJ_02840 [Oryza sativa Japonica Group]
MCCFLLVSVLLATTLTDVASAQRWRQTSGGGKDRWDGLLDPLDADLRRDIIRYGELAQATSDALIGDPASPFAGASRYAPDAFLRKVRASDPDAYRVTRFVYATSSVRLPDAFMPRPGPSAGAQWSGESNWMGYVAVATDGRRREGREAGHRGGVARDEARGGVGQRPGHHAGAGGRRRRSGPGLDAAVGAQGVPVLAEITRLLRAYKNENCSITITGHSLGAALSTLNAIDIVANGYNVRGSSRVPVPVTAIALASPRVGDDQFKRAFDSTSNLSLLRVRNAPDIVPTILPSAFFKDVGAELLVDTRRSPYLKNPAGPGPGAGDGAGFSLVVDRDLALVNKEVDALRDEYQVPAAWWVEKNKGMVQNASGRWVLQDHEEGNLAM